MFAIESNGFRLISLKGELNIRYSGRSDQAEKEECKMMDAAVSWNELLKV